MSRNSEKQKEVLEQYGLSQEDVPEHIAVIMDGNGRWAGKRHLARINGHREAMKAVKSCIETCKELGVKYLTLFAFSVDNWKRPREEINALMDLLQTFLKRERKVLVKNKIRFMVVGDIKKFSEPIQKEIDKSIKATAEFDENHLILALNYGGRADIIQGVKKCIEKYSKGDIGKNGITEEFFSDCLFTRGIPDPDLLIRTSGEQRLSNFMLWQISYTEFWIPPVLWPDFSREDLIAAVVDYSKRERRFGGVAD